jgi:hypothetical protein
MALVRVCNRCGRRLDGQLERQTERYVAVLEVASLGGLPHRVELDLCSVHAAEMISEFERSPFMDHIEGLDKIMSMPLTSHSE